MADSFFGFDTSLSNLNDDEGGGEPSEDEYDALNDETFGQDFNEIDWEVEHEHLAGQLESSRRHNIDDVNSQLEASLSQLVLDYEDSKPRTLGSSVWRHEPAPPPPAARPAPTLKNVCTVEELERQLRQKQQPAHNMFQPRYPPVILQRPPGLQAPAPLPFAPQQQIQANPNQPLNKIIGQGQVGQQNMLQNHMGQNQINQNVTQFMQNTNQMGFQNNQMNMSQNMQSMQASQMLQNQISHHVNHLGQTMNHMGPGHQNMQIGPNMHGQHQNQMGQNHQGTVQNMGMQNQVGQGMNQMGQGMNQMGPNVNQMGPNVNQMGPNVNQMGGQNMNQMGQNVSQMGQSVNQMGQGINHMGQNMNLMGQNVNQMGQNVNQMGQNVNQMGQNINQMWQNQMPNGNQFGGMWQFPHMMGQRMIAPPPGMGMARPNFNPNMGPFNPNFRGPTMQKPEPQINQNQMPMNQQYVKNQSPQVQQKTNQSQLPQSPQTTKQPNKTQKPVDQKPQKTRVFNAKAQPPMTSQNLVQLIQNTHPMLQMNSSYHNASHHPMLNNRNMFSNNNQFGSNNVFSAQRHNGTLNSSRQMNGDDGSMSGDDEYADLMTPREKQWLINIQMLQLNIGTPYIHDFYYTVFRERQASKEKEGVKEAHKANQQNHPFYSGAVKQENHTHTRERHNSNRHNSTSEDAATPRTYVPMQFENSLGKLQCCSVTAPRKIIDVELVPADTRPPSRAPSRASTANPAEVPRELKRTKQLLLDIESLYLILLRLEELNDPLAIANALVLKEREEKQKLLEAAQKELENEQEDDSNLFLKNIESVQRRPKQESPKSESIDKRQVVNLAVSQKPPVKNLLDEDKEDLVNRMFAGLLHSDRLQQMLTVRKGRILIARFLSRVPPAHARLRALWSRVLRSVSSAARRDDGTLAILTPHYRRYIQSSSGWGALVEACGALAEALDPARTPHALSSAFTLSCVCVLVEKAATLVNTPEATSNERQWSKFLKTLARALKNTTLTVARPLQPLPESKLMYHIKILESRSTIEILQRGKSALEYDVSKTDVQEQLVKHLC